MRVYVVLKIVDLGGHVCAVCSDLEGAEREIENLKKEYAPGKYEIEEWEVLSR